MGKRISPSGAFSPDGENPFTPPARPGRSRRYVCCPPHDPPMPTTTLHPTLKLTTLGDTLRRALDDARAAGARPAPASDRREARRCDLSAAGIPVDRWSGPRAGRAPLGTLVDLSATGMRLRVPADAEFRVGAQLRVQLTLPSYAGLHPFVRADGTGQGSDEWTGWLTVVRVVENEDGTRDLAGPLVDMREIDRGMLGLYLSARPLAA